MPLQLPASGPVAREQRFQISIRPLHAALPRGFEASRIKEDALHFAGPIDAVHAQRHVERQHATPLLRVSPRGARRLEPELLIAER